MISVIIRFVKEMHISFSRHNVYNVLLVTMFIMLISAVSFYYCENPNIEGLSFWDAVWWSFVTVTTVGYGDYFPTTLPGRLLAVVLMISGIGSFGFVTAAVASTFVEINMRRGMGLVKLELKDHFVIVGWNKRARNIVEELVREMPDRPVVVIDDIERLDIDYKQVFFVKGKGTEDSILEKAAIGNASMAIVLSDNRDTDEESADAHSVLVCLAISHLNPDIHLVAEVLNGEHLPHFKRANVDEVFISSQISSKLLVRGALYPRVSHAINELLTNSRGSEFYEIQLPQRYWGMTFKELVGHFTNEGKGIPIGIADGEGTYVNPEMDYTIKKGDILVYIGREACVL